MGYPSRAAFWKPPEELQRVSEAFWRRFGDCWSGTRASQSRFGVSLVPFWSHLGAMLARLKHHSGQRSFSERVPKLSFEGCLERNHHSQRLRANLSRGEGGLPGKLAQRGRLQRGSDSLTRLFTPFRGRRILKIL